MACPELAEGFLMAGSSNPVRVLLFIHLFPQTGQQVQYFDIQPDQCNQYAKGSVPIHEGRQALSAGALEKIKVQQQIKSRETDDHQADADPRGEALYINTGWAPTGV